MAYGLKACSCHPLRFYYCAILKKKYFNMHEGLAELEMFTMISAYANQNL